MTPAACCKRSAAWQIAALVLTISLLPGCAAGVVPSDPE
jgi:hypothetical protein